MQTMRSELAGCPIIVGGGLAGLMTALRLAPRPVILLAKVPLNEGAASAWAQGGIAAAVGEDDRPALHAADTLAAGDGLSDPAERVAPLVEALLAERAAARAARDFARADALREQLAAEGVILEDTPQGVRWVRKRA